MRSSGRLLLSRIGQQHQPYTLGALHSATYARFYTTHNPRGDMKGFSYLGFDWWWLWDVGSFFKDLMLKKGCVIVREGSICIVERSMKYDRELTPGLNFMIPFKDRVAYVQSLKVRPLAFDIPRAFSKDKVEMKISVCLFYKIVDPILASYEVKDMSKRMISLADTIIQKNVGRKTFDELSQESETLNKNIRKNMCDEFKGWGLSVLHVDLRDMLLPENMEKTMGLEARKMLEKSARITKSEAYRDLMNIIADAKKTANILIAEGEAEAEVLKEEAKSEAVSKLAVVMRDKTTDRAVIYKLLSKAVDTFGKIVEHGTTFNIPEK